MRHGHNLQIRETREIDLAHENRDNIADNQAEQHGKLLGGTLHQQLESQAGDQRNQTEREILPASEILSAGTAAETGGTNGKQRKTNRRNHNRGYDRRYEATPILGGQTKHYLQQAAKHNRAGDRAVALVLGDRHGSSHIGEGNARDHWQSGTDQPHAVQLQASAQTCHQQTGLNDRGRLLGTHVGGGSHQENRSQIGHEHRHDMLQAERDALPERNRCVQAA